MFNSPLNKTTQELVQAARAATSDYLTNGTDLTQAVVKVASKMQPITSEHVRRICEMTYHDAYERSFAEKTGMHQYVSFDPPDAILAAEALDAIQLGANQQQVFDKLASYKNEASAPIPSNFKPREKLAGLPMNTRNRIYGLFTKEAGNTKGGPGVFGEDKRKQDAQIAAEKLKEQAQPAQAPDIDKKVVKNVDEVVEGVDDVTGAAKKSKGFFGNMSGRNKMLLGGAGALLGYGAYRAGQNNAPSQPTQQKVASLPNKFRPMNAFDIHISAAPGEKLADHNPTRELQQVHRDLKDSISTVKSELYAAENNEKLAMIDMVKQAKAGLSEGHSMEQVLYAALSVVDATEPFMAKTAHDLCATIIEACADHQNSGFRKEAKSGNILPDPILDRTAQLFTYGGRGLAHGMTQPLEAISNSRGIARAAMAGDPYAINNLGYLPGTALGLSVAPTAGYIGYKKITEGDDENTPKTAQVFMGQKEMMDKAKKNSEGWKKNPMKLIYNFDHNKTSSVQEVNPNHPIPQKFKKLAEANIQRKHLEVTLDELNRNMDYFNEQLKNELFR